MSKHTLKPDISRSTVRTSSRKRRSSYKDGDKRSQYRGRSCVQNYSNKQRPGHKGWERDTQDFSPWSPIKAFPLKESFTHKDLKYRDSSRSPVRIFMGDYVVKTSFGVCDIESTNQDKTTENKSDDNPKTVAKLASSQEKDYVITSKEESENHVNNQQNINDDKEEVEGTGDRLDDMCKTIPKNTYSKQDVSGSCTPKEKVNPLNIIEENVKDNVEDKIRTQKRADLERENVSKCASSQEKGSTSVIQEELFENQINNKEKDKNPVAILAKERKILGFSKENESGGRYSRKISENHPRENHVTKANEKVVSNDEDNSNEVRSDTNCKTIFNIESSIENADLSSSSKEQVNIVAIKGVAKENHISNLLKINTISSAYSGDKEQLEDENEVEKGDKPCAQEDCQEPPPTNNDMSSSGKDYPDEVKKICRDIIEKICHEVIKIDKIPEEKELPNLYKSEIEMQKETIILSESEASTIFPIQNSNDHSTSTKDNLLLIPEPEKQQFGGNNSEMKKASTILKVKLTFVGDGIPQEICDIPQSTDSILNEKERKVPTLPDPTQKPKGGKIKGSRNIRSNEIIGISIMENSNSFGKIRLKKCSVKIKLKDVCSANEKLAHVQINPDPEHVQKNEGQKSGHVQQNGGQKPGHVQQNEWKRPGQIQPNEGQKSGHVQHNEWKKPCRDQQNKELRPGHKLRNMEQKPAGHEEQNNHLKPAANTNKLGKRIKERFLLSPSILKKPSNFQKVGIKSNMIQDEKQNPRDETLEDYGEHSSAPEVITPSSVERRKRRAEFTRIRVEKPKKEKMDEMELLNKARSCGICSKMFSSDDTLEKHMNRHRQNKAVNDGNAHKSVYRCAKCDKDKFFSNAASIVAHLESKHTEEGEKKIKCVFPVCPFQGKREDLIRHVRSKHTKENHFPCSGCDKKFASYEALNGHERSSGHKQSI